MGGVRGRGRAGSPGPELLLLLPPCCRGTMSGSDSTGTSMLFGATAWEKAPKEGKKAPTKKEGGLYKGKVGVGGGVGSASSGQRPRAAAGGGSEAHRPVCWAPAPWGQERPGQRHTQPEARQQRHPNHREHGGEHHCRTRGATRSSGRPGGQGRATTGAGGIGLSCLLSSLQASMRVGQGRREGDDGGRVGGSQPPRWTCRVGGSQPPLWTCRGPASLQQESRAGQGRAGRCQGHRVGSSAAKTRRRGQAQTDG